MHELSLIADLMKKIESVVQEKQAKRVLQVTVALGALSHISPEHFREHFVHASKNTVAESAELTITEKSDPADPQAQDIMLETLELET